MSGLNQILSGTVWMVAARWTIRGIGLVSTLVLARLLIPTDFGIAEMSMVVIGFIEVFGETGLLLHLIRHPNPPRSHFDTVFTLRLLTSLALGAAMLLAAPFGARFFHEPRVADAIRALAFRPVLSGIQNPGVVLFRRNMTFNKDFEFQVVNKALSFILTIGLAFTFRNYWALIIGVLCGGVIATLQTYRMHPYRPRLDLSATREVWGFSAWMLVQSMLTFLNQRVDQLIVGRLKSTTAMGYYALASDVASSPLNEIVAPLGRVLFPGLVRLTRETQDAARVLRKVLAGVGIVAMSISAGIALVAGDLTQVVLGPKWISIVPLLQMLAISTGLLSLAAPVQTSLNAGGQPGAVAGLSFLRQVMLVAAMLPAAAYGSLLTVAIARTVVGAATFIITMGVAAQLLGFRTTDLGRSLLRPALATVAMVAVVLLVQTISPTFPPIRLILSVVAGAVSFASSLFLLWRISGRPDSAEGDFVGMITTVLLMIRERLPLIS